MCIVVDAHCCVHDLVCLAVIPLQDSKVGASSSTTLTCVKFIVELLEQWNVAQGQCAHAGGLAMWTFVSLQLTKANRALGIYYRLVACLMCVHTCQCRCTIFTNGLNTQHLNYCSLQQQQCRSSAMLSCYCILLSPILTLVGAYSAHIAVYAVCSGVIH